MKSTLVDLGDTLGSIDRKLNRLFQTLSKCSFNLPCMITGMSDSTKAFGKLLTNIDIEQLPTVGLDMMYAYVTGIDNGIITGVILDDRGGEFISIDFEDILHRNDKLMLLETILDTRIKIRLREIEIEVKREAYLDRISGGFADAQVIDYVEEGVQIRLKSGVSSDVHRDVVTETFVVTYEEILK